MIRRNRFAETQKVFLIKSTLLIRLIFGSLPDLRRAPSVRTANREVNNGIRKFQIKSQRVLEQRAAQEFDALLRLALCFQRSASVFRF